MIPKLKIEEISAEEARSLYLESIYSEEAKAEAFYREHCPPYEE